MLTVISPAKKLDLNPTHILSRTTPVFLTEANNLAKNIRQLSLNEHKNLMSISEKLADLNKKRFSEFKSNPKVGESFPAIFSFAGDTYIGLEAKSLETDTLQYAQNYLRILSGLYGILRPFDAIQPYRLEMGSKLQNNKGRSLYKYWGNMLSLELNSHAKKVKAETLINCASKEYFGAIDLSTLKLKVVTPTFLEKRPDGEKIISFFAKRARGAMARFIIENRLTDPNSLKDFNIGGYKFIKERSNESELIFIR